MSVRINKLVAVLPVLIFVAGCATTHAPNVWLSNPDQLQNEAFGGWIQVQYSNVPSVKKKESGELIAVSYDSLYVLDRFNLVAVASADVTKARLVTYDAHTGELSGWVLLGTLSTLSHGWYLVLTAPLLWGLAGSIAASSRSHDPIIDYPRHSFDAFRPYARFPQGLPRHLNRKALMPKEAY